MPIDINITSEHVKSATILAHFINSLEALDLVDEIDEQWIMQAILAIRLAFLEQKCEAIAHAMKVANEPILKNSTVLPSSRR